MTYIHKDYEVLATKLRNATPVRLWRKTTKMALKLNTINYGVREDDYYK